MDALGSVEVATHGVKTDKDDKDRQHTETSKKSKSKKSARRRGKNYKKKEAEKDTTAAAAHLGGTADAGINVLTLKLGRHDMPIPSTRASATSDGIAHDQHTAGVATLGAVGVGTSAGGSYATYVNLRNQITSCCTAKCVRLYWCPEPEPALWLLENGSESECQQSETQQKNTAAAPAPKTKDLAVAALDDLSSSESESDGDL